MRAFEPAGRQGVGLHSYGEALWWTAMMMTTMGSQYWPRSPEGRVLCVLLALYAFAVFGYVTAMVATMLIGHEARRDDAEGTLQALRREIAELRRAVQDLVARSEQPS
jgi:voltage-gated potassium channel